MTRIVLIAALVVASTAAHAQPACPPERTIDALASAVARVAPLFTRPRAGPQGGPAPQPHPLSRDERREQIIAQGREFCAAYPDDRVCGEMR